jgi:L-amino acid N-acyltransferase YncA
MAKLTAKEQALLEKLAAKAEAPDSGPVSRSLSASINLGNPAEVKLAQKYGFLDSDDDDDDGDAGDGDGDADAGDTPKRRGYFKDA